MRIPDQDVIEGIIPARAGFTCVGVGGGQVLIGSSPLARGLHDYGIITAPDTRIIPARAGFTTRRIVITWRRRGSSPLARGLLGVVHSGHGRARIIPARAGFTEVSHWCRPHSEDHPRSRGVYFAQKRPNVASQGSSPLARGLPTCSTRPVRTVGIIPARAGFTCS